MTAGVTELVPPAVGVEVPIPWFNTNDEAFVEVQVSVDDPPALMTLGEALKVHAGALGGGGRTPIEALHITVPPGPVNVAV